jgi:hypothetical protein
MEIINHITGACGEPHLNINIILGMILVSYIVYKFNKKKYDNN